MLPPSWKSEVQKAVEETANADRQQREAQQNNASADITAAIIALRDAQHAQTSSEDANEQKNRPINKITLTFVFLTAIFTGLSWLAFRAQLGEMIRAYDFADANAKRQLRPNVLPVDGSVLLRGKTAYTATFNLKNTGQTPAFSVSNWAATRVDISDVSTSGAVLHFARQEVEREASSTDLGSGLPYSISSNGTLLPADLDDLISGKKVFWMWGRVWFDDYLPTSKERTATIHQFEEFLARSTVPAKITDPWPLIVIRNDVADESMPLDRKP